jgi:MoxR-like ATPase
MNEQQLQNKIARLTEIKNEIGKVIVGQQKIIEELLISILAGGHCLLEGVPGLAKTLIVSTLAETMDLNFCRVQFTPDLMPSDIIGTEILEEDHASGKRFFKFQQGPVFTNILLADEINRTPPKTQAALLEAMQEKRVSYAGQSYDLPKPFFVLATQNPVEQSGTYPLPEAQLDRFLMFIRVGYPSQAEEIEILKRTTGNQSVQLKAIINDKEILELQDLVRDVEISEPLLAYITRMVRQTRPDETEISVIKQYVRWGAGPRAGQALVLCAKARALLSGRYSVTLEDIAFVAPAVLRHRVLINFQAEADSMSNDKIIAELQAKVAKPKSKII